MIKISATNRGSKRNESDFYKTPESTVHNFLNSYNCNMNESNIFEPCAGDGSICKVIKEKYPTSKIAANEIRKEERIILSNYCNIVTCQDFLQYSTLDDSNIDFIISNPPYSIAQEIIEHCFKIKSFNTKIIMLLRLAFLESKKRYTFWQNHPVSELYILSQRPSFTGSGTDATAYAWFVWNESSGKQLINVI